MKYVPIRQLHFWIGIRHDINHAKESWMQVLHISNQCPYSPSVANFSAGLEYNKCPGTNEHNNCISFGKIHLVMMNVFMHGTSFLTFHIKGFELQLKFWNVGLVPLIIIYETLSASVLWQEKINWLIRSCRYVCYFNGSIDSSSIIKCPFSRLRQVRYGRHSDASQQRPDILANIDDFLWPIRRHISNE